MQGIAPAVGIGGPWCGIIVIYFFDWNPVAVLTEFLIAGDLDFQLFPPVVKFTVVWSVDIAGQGWVHGRVLGDDNILAGFDDGIGWELISGPFQAPGNIFG